MATARRKFGLSPIALNLHNSTLYEPQRSNHFEIYIYLPSSITNGDSAKADELAKYITLAVKNASLPTHSNQAVTINYGNTAINLAGTATVGGTQSVNCIDYIGADIEGILYSWRNIVYNPETSQVGWAINYKTTAQLVEYAGDGSCIASWVLQGVWPQSVNFGGSLSKDQGSLKEVQVTLQYDVGYRKFGTSTRNTHGTMASTALANMVWKEQSKYQDGEDLSLNNGGPLNHIQDNLGD